MGRIGYYMDSNPSRQLKINETYELDKTDDQRIKILKKQISAIRKAKREREKQRAIYFKEVFQQLPGSPTQSIQSDNYGYTTVPTQDD